jgi:hypothetical protein
MPEGSLASSVGDLDKTNGALLDRPKTQLWLRYSPVIPYSYKQNLHINTATGRFEILPGCPGGGLRIEGLRTDP